MLEGNKTEVSKNPDNNSGAVFRSSAPLANLIEVKVDENVLVKDKDYTACSGSTIITLLPSFLAGLSEGAHNIAIVSTTGTATAGNFRFCSGATSSGTTGIHTCTTGIR